MASKTACPLSVTVPGDLPGLRLGVLLAMAAFLGLAACSDDVSRGTPTSPDDNSVAIQCTVPLEEIFDGGVGRDGIIALQKPPLVAPDDPGAAYLEPHDRVVGLRDGDQALAIPLNILWFHEVVNLSLSDRAVAVTYCPLTGSYLVFDRGPMDDVDLGVSGLIWRNNLIVFDRRPDQAGESLWSQMLRRGICGPERRRFMETVPAVEMTWEGWQALHPDTEVVSSDTGFNRNYSQHPNPEYEIRDNPDTFFPRVRQDDRRPPKERLLGIPLALDGGIAFPFGEMERAPLLALEQPTPYGRVAVFWDREVAGAAAFLSEVDGQELTFRVEGGQIVDTSTGSVWNLAGDAVEGPLEGRSLEPFAEAYVAFWFAWADFQPETLIWQR